MKIIYMGTPDFAVLPLRKIVEAGHEVALVVTKQDRPAGRGNKMLCSPVKECAEELGIPVFQPERIKRPESVQILREYDADVFVVAAFGQILSKEILTMPKYGCINIHGSLLPKYRGAAPIQWAVLNGEKESGVTIMQMNEGIDTGDILLQRSMPLAIDETGDSLFNKLMILGANLITEALEQIADGTVARRPQGDVQGEYACMLTKAMGHIHWETDAVKLERFIRGLNSWPGTYTYLGDKMMKIWKASVIQEDSSLLPGMVEKVSQEGIVVQTGAGRLLLTEVQMEGKKRMPVREFLLGYKIEPSMRFGG